jgi:transmembrane 9 superfamily protein 3
MVSACVTIVATYFLLNAEDWRWHWVSFSAPASTAVYVFLYSVYYFLTKTQMTGVLQICYYFSHMGVLSVCVALFCGAIGHVTADLFVRKIYKDIKSD